MTIEEMINTARKERARAASYLEKLDAVLSTLEEPIQDSESAPPHKRKWTPEQKARLSAALRKHWAAKKLRKKG